MTAGQDPIQQGLRAWADGDLAALKAVLDPDVTLRAVEPGPWDCVGRAQVMRLLRRRQTEGVSAYPVHVDRIDDETFSVHSERPDPPEGFPVATRITVEAGRVIAMQQYRAG